MLGVAGGVERVTIERSVDYGTRMNMGGDQLGVYKNGKRKKQANCIRFNGILAGYNSKCFFFIQLTFRNFFPLHAYVVSCDTHTHTHINIHIYVYIYWHLWCSRCRCRKRTQQTEFKSSVRHCLHFL